MAKKNKNIFVIPWSGVVSGRVSCNCIELYLQQPGGIKRAIFDGRLCTLGNNMQITGDFRRASFSKTLAPIMFLYIYIVLFSIYINPNAYFDSLISIMLLFGSFPVSHLAAACAYEYINWLDRKHKKKVLAFIETELQGRPLTEFQCASLKNTDYGK